MPFLVSPPKKIYSQPAGVQRINRQNPLSRNLVVAGWPGQGYYAAQPGSVVPSKDSRNLGAFAWENPSGVTATTQPLINVPAASGTEWTVVCEFKWAAQLVGFQSGLILVNTSGGTAHNLFLEYDNRASGWLGQQGGGNFGVFIRTATSLISYSNFVQFAATVSGSAGTANVYAPNGVSIGSLASGISGSTSVSQIRMFRDLGGYPSPASAGTQISFFAVWNRVLTPNELAEVNRNPYQLVAKPDQQFFYPGQAPVTTIYEFQSLNRGVGRGIARGIA